MEDGARLLVQKREKLEDYVHIALIGASNENSNFARRRVRRRVRQRVYFQVHVAWPGYETTGSDASNKLQYLVCDHICGILMVTCTI